MFKSKKIVINTLCTFLALVLIVSYVSPIAFADSYDNEWMECNYITQCSMSAANSTVGAISTSTPGYGAMNGWRIGNGAADYTDPGASAIGVVGLLYGYNRLSGSGRSNSTLDSNAKTALSTYFWSFVRNGGNQINVGGNIAFPTSINYNTAGNITSFGTASAASTAEILIAMRKYCELSPNGDRANYQSQEYDLAHKMAQYIDSSFGSWTVDRSYVVAAFHCFANWANAVGDGGTASYYHGRANTVSSWLANAQDTGSWSNYYDYLDGSGRGVYNGGINQTGFSPYEFNARPAGEDFAKKLGDWWNHGQAYNNAYLSEQGGTYVGGVHQWTPASGINYQVYPGSSLQLADALWKIARATGNYNDFYREAWAHYNFAMSTLGSSSGSGCWVNNTSVDGVSGGFIDWVNTSNGSRPANWQRFIDTSGYAIVATEELVFSNMVDWSY